MASWKTSATRLGRLLDARFDRLHYGLKRRLGYDQPLQVVAYDGYGDADTLYLGGRVLEDHGHGDAVDRETLWRNLAASYRRFESDEVPGLRVRATFQGQSAETITDEEGYFDFKLPVVQPLDMTRPWHSVALAVPPQAMLKRPPPEPTAGRVWVPAPACDFGVISDIDDTVLVTHATRLLTMARLTFLRSSRARLPFAGVAAFYRALRDGGPHPRPLFYVSSSPWNLYDFLVDFMALNQIPAGPLRLRDLGLPAESTAGSSHQAHKLAQIERIMNTYPKLPFILIGDSGQRDPEAYTQVVAARPRQVRAIYIRDVTQTPRRDRDIAVLSEQTRQHNIELLLVDNTLQAAEHAACNGFIDPASLASISAGNARDAAVPGPIERLISGDG